MVKDLCKSDILVAFMVLLLWGDAELGLVSKDFIYVFPDASLYLFIAGIGGLRSVLDKFVKLKC